MYTNTAVRVYTHLCASTNVSLFLFSTCLQLKLCLYTNFTSLYTNAYFSRRVTPFLFVYKQFFFCIQSKKRVYNHFVDMSKKGKYTHFCVSTNFENVCVYKLFCLSLVYKHNQIVSTCNFARLQTLKMTSMRKFARLQTLTNDVNVHSGTSTNFLK